MTRLPALNGAPVAWSRRAVAGGTPRPAWEIAASATAQKTARAKAMAALRLSLSRAAAGLRSVRRLWWTVGTDILLLCDTKDGRGGPDKARGFLLTDCSYRDGSVLK